MIRAGSRARECANRDLFTLYSSLSRSTVAHLLRVFTNAKRVVVPRVQGIRNERRFYRYKANLARRQRANSGYILRIANKRQEEL